MSSAPPFMPASPLTLALFCKVVDNFGDIGICWRFARQLQHEHGIQVSLWVDDLLSFQKICPQINITAENQLADGVRVIHWHDQNGSFAPADIADIVIEFFACDIPPGYVQTMAACSPRPVWFNLEGLSAETWVEGCHQLSSPHPQLSLTKYFFFPGFTEKTGGLLLENNLLAARDQFQQDASAPQEFLRQLGLSEQEIAGFKVSLFCYPHAPVHELFKVWENAAIPISCLIPEGVARDAAAAWLGQAAIAGAGATRGNLSVRILPFVAQPDYDKLLWACDLNFVRGEDSFVRAQWAGKPFIWHIYPQDDNLHHVKLKAFLKRYAGELSGLIALNSAWNDMTTTPPDWEQIWSDMQTDLPASAELASNWQAQMLKNGDMTSNLLRFAGTIRGSKPEK